MKLFRVSFYIFTYCILLFCLTSCHLDKKTDTSARKPSPTKTSPQPVKKAFIWSGTLDVSGGSKKIYRNLLREHRRCDPCTIYVGPLECENFDDRGRVELQLDQNTELPAKAVLRITPISSKHNALPLYGWLGACGTTYNHGPIEFTGSVKHFNDFQGFNVRFTGKGGLSAVTVRSEFSSPLDNGLLEVDIYYGGSVSDSTKFGEAELENANLENLYPSQGTGER